jgi:hypothetical protein
MEFVSLFLELMADMRFAILSIGFVLGLMILLRLLVFLGEKENPGLSMESSPGATVMEAPADSPMMWGGEPAGKKKPVKPQAGGKALPPGGPSAAAPAIASPAPAVDVHLYEALVRRISSIETDLKREPLYLDPIIKRLTALEKKAEELAQKAGEAGKAGGGLPDGFSQEYQSLKGKVVELQRMLEHLSEGPTPPPQ